MLSPGVVLQQRYRIKRMLAHGGMGAVYEAEAVHLRNVIVAVKETFYGEDRKNLRDQFEREAATLARLRHPALPQIKDHFIEGGGQFLVMEYIDGDDLGELLVDRLNEKGGPFDVLQVLEWAERLLDALAYIHSQYPPVIHRDIKPQNLKLTPRGELFLIDFGLAKDATTPTRPGHSVRAYTLEFAPPEQIRGERTDERSDLYSLGATLYALVTGKLPPDARVREESVVKHLMPDLLQPAHRVNPRIPFAFAAALAKSMALDRKRRYQSAQEMQDALRRIKRALETEIAERERQEEESRQRKTGRRRQPKDSAQQPFEGAEKAEAAKEAKEAKEAKGAKRVVKAAVVEVKPHEEEMHESKEKESRQRKTGRRRQPKDSAQQASEKAERAGAAKGTGGTKGAKGTKGTKGAKRAVKARDAEKGRQEDEEPKKLGEASRRRKEAARLATVLDEVDGKEGDQGELQLALPQEAATKQISSDTDAFERRFDRGNAASEPAQAEPPVRKKTLRVALGAIAGNLIIALLAYLLWNLALLAYLLWPASSTKVNAAANPPTGVVAKPIPSPSPAASYVVLPGGIEMIFVPGGSFLMGSPENEPGRHSSEGPQHRVNVPGFYIGKYEVTQAQWRAVIGGDRPYINDDFPESVSWNDAKEFCRKLSLLTGEEYRLPTEAEWEYACRAMTDGAYAGDLDSMAWYSENSGGRTHPVGQKRPNAFGLFDMRGNASEWCEDYWHDGYANAPSDGSAWINAHERGSGHVYRGGFWNSAAADCRSASRYNAFLPDDGLGLAWGFRLVRTYR